ncbi:MAG: tetratricopeptide repeat protein [Phycisphaerales bacterium]
MSMSSIAESLSLAMQNHQAGNLREAEEMYKSILSRNPRNANALHLLGVLHAQTGRPEDAVGFIRNAIQVHDGEAPFHFNLGRALTQVGRHEEALAAFDETLRLRPDFAAAMGERANALRRLGRIEESIEAYEKAVEASPQDADLMNNFAMTLVNNNRLDRGIQMLQQAIRVRPNFTQARANLGKAAIDAGQHDLAVEHLQEVVELIPNDPTVHNNYGNALVQKGRATDAIAHFRRALELDPEYATCHVNLGNAYRNAKFSDDAIRHYRRALELDPTLAQSHYGIAAIHERLNNLEPALAEVDRTLELQPDHRGALPLRGRILRRLERLEEAEAHFRGIIENESLARMHGQAYVELGQVLDKRKAYDEAFESFATGQQLLSERPASQRYDWTAYLTFISDAGTWIRDTGPQEWETDWADSDHESPIFFVGFPRSGTTLTEQILASHPRLVATDEAPLIAGLLNRVPELLGHRPPFPGGVAELQREHVLELRRQYWEEARRHVSVDNFDGVRLIDKLPLNIVNLPVIRRIFPEAKVITAIRDPRDACLSCFMQEFKPNVAMIHFYSLETTARLYAGVMDLWLQYREKLGLPWIETRYEDLVEDLESAARRMLEFIDEPWDDAVLEYAERSRDRMVSTPSYAAVSQPVYRTARQRWRNYEKHFDSVMPTLEPFIRTFGYETT